MDLTFDKIYTFSVFAMKANLSHPSINKDKKWFLQFLLMYAIFSVMFFLLMNSIINYDLKNKDFSLICRNGCLGVLYFITTLSYCVMFFHQKTLKTLIDSMNKDYAEVLKLSTDEQNIVLDYAKQGVYVCYQWLMMGIFGVGAFVMKTIVLYAYYYYIDDLKLVPIHEMTYPRVIEEYKDEIIVYALLYMGFVYYGTFAAFMYAAFVPLGPVFMLHCCGQLDIMQRRLENLFILHSHEEASEKLKDVIRQLQYVYSLVEKTETCFKGFYELTLKATTVTLPIAVYEFIESFHNGEIRVEFLVFIIGAIIKSSSPCYYSQLLMEKGEQVRLAVYYSGWEGAAPRTSRSTLLFILQRALKPIAIQTMFRTVCLDELTDLFHQAYAFFNLMNAMWK